VKRKIGQRGREVEGINRIREDRYINVGDCVRHCGSI
jgi:hypothetical protein